MTGIQHDQQLSKTEKTDEVCLDVIEFPISCFTVKLQMCAFQLSSQLTLLHKWVVDIWLKKMSNVDHGNQLYSINSYIHKYICSRVCPGVYIYSLVYCLSD